MATNRLLLAVVGLFLALATVTAAAAAATSHDERLIGAYIFHRHGDRTAKAWKPVNLTALGARQAYSSGAFYRARYLDAGELRVVAASGAQRALSPNAAALADLAVTSPRDAVLHSSALAFLQGLYPPVANAADRLANGSVVAPPLGGYQYVPVEPVAGAHAAEKPEDSVWLQGGGGCPNAERSSHAYLDSSEYRGVDDASRHFYRSLAPVVAGTYDDEALGFMNGYSIFDLINVATIHNASIPSSDLVTPAALARLYQLASVHEWNLAFNASDPVRAMAGAVLAGHVLAALQDLVDAKPKAPRLHAQFGAYGTFMAFFGLAQLPAASPDFRAICDYASSMAFELVTRAPAGAPVEPDQISVRFLFANGTAAEHGLRPYPLFGQDRLELPWADFKEAMSDFAVVDSAHWCRLCGKTDGKCAAAAAAAAVDGGASSPPGRRALSNPVAGVIGALVTLVVILGVQAAVVLLGGLRLVKRSSLAGAPRSSVAYGPAGTKTVSDVS